MANSKSVIEADFYAEEFKGASRTGLKLYKRNSVELALRVTTDRVTSSTRSDGLQFKIFIYGEQGSVIGTTTAKTGTGVLEDAYVSYNLVGVSSAVTAYIDIQAGFSAFEIDSIEFFCIFSDINGADYTSGYYKLYDFQKISEITVTYNAGSYGTSAKSETIEPNDSNQITVGAANLIEPKNDAYSYTKWVVNTRSVIEGDPEYVTAGDTIKLTTWSNLSLTPYWGGYARIKYLKGDSDASGEQSDTVSDWFAEGTTVELKVAEFEMTAPDGYGFKTWMSGRQGYTTS